jgi:putative copper resistance protein D
LDLLLEASRFVTYAAALQLFGVAAFQFALAPANLRAALDPWAGLLCRLSALALPLGMLGWLAATAGGMGNGWASGFDGATLWLVLSATAFGHVWLPLLILAIGLCGSSLLFRANWVALTIGAALLLVGLGLVGHAAVAGGITGLLNRLSQAVHLITSAFWLGSLLPLLLSLPHFRDPELMGDAGTMLRRFSGLGHLAVALLLGSGVANSWFVLGAQLDFTQPYQQLLLVKIALAGLMVCLATINRYVFVPLIPEGGPGLRRLARGTIAEIVLSAGVLGLVSIIGTLAPG